MPLQCRPVDHLPHAINWSAFSILSKFCVNSKFFATRSNLVNGQIVIDKVCANLFFLFWNNFYVHFYFELETFFVNWVSRKVSNVKIYKVSHTITKYRTSYNNEWTSVGYRMTFGQFLSLLTHHAYPQYTGYWTETMELMQWIYVKCLKFKQELWTLWPQCPLQIATNMLKITRNWHSFDQNSHAHCISYFFLRFRWKFFPSIQSCCVYRWKRSFGWLFSTLVLCA